MSKQLHAPWCWVHELDDYVQMFDLSAQDLTLKILDCAAGPSSFAAELTQRGGRVVACDPLYEKVTEKVEMKTHEMIDALMEKVSENQDQFSWHTVASPDELKHEHHGTAELFLEDFKNDKQRQRYRGETLPTLSFTDYEFDLALCANFLFDGLQRPEPEFITACIKEMCRVAREVRVYPLLNSEGEIAEEVGPVMMQLQQDDYGVEIREVDYQFQKKSNAMLRVWPNTCVVE